VQPLMHAGVWGAVRALRARVCRRGEAAPSVPLYAYCRRGSAEESRNSGVKDHKSQRPAYPETVLLCFNFQSLSLVWLGTLGKNGLLAFG